MGEIMTYNCPFCNKEMKQGWIPITQGFTWDENPQPRVKGEVILLAEYGKNEHRPESSTKKGFARNIEAHICQECKKVLINYE